MLTGKKKLNPMDFVLSSNWPFEDNANANQEE